MLVRERFGAEPLEVRDELLALRHQAACVEDA
jgi:hypothetical protein